MIKFKDLQKAIDNLDIVGYNITLFVKDDKNRVWRLQATEDAIGIYSYDASINKLQGQEELWGECVRFSSFESVADAVEFLTLQMLRP